MRCDRKSCAKFFEQPYSGVLATLRRDRTPYTIPLWYLWEGDVPDDMHPANNPPVGSIWLTGSPTRIWCKHLLNNDAMSFCIDTAGPPPQHVGVDGTVEPYMPDEFDIWPIMRRIVEKYVGRGDPANDEAVEGYLTMMQSEVRMLFKVTPTSLAGGGSVGVGGGSGRLRGRRSGLRASLLGSLSLG